MIDVNGVLQGMSDMRSAAQANVPVVPNNGNPQGAHNMQAAVPVSPMLQHYPWMAPSQFMTSVQRRLSSPAPAVAPVQQPPTQMPTAANALPVMPQMIR